MRRILSEKLKMETYLLNKISLSCYDNKRYILDDGMGEILWHIVIKT